MAKPSLDLSPERTIVSGVVNVKFSKVDFWLGSAVFAITLVSSLVCTIFLGSLLHIPIEFSGIVKIGLFILFLFIFTGLILKLVRLIQPLKEGVFWLDRSREGVFWKLQGFLYIFNLGIFMNTYLVPVNLRSLVYSFLGAKIGKSVMIGGKILEPPLVEVGDYSQVGEDALITAHAVERDKLTLGKIRIGKNVTIGVKSVVFPDVQIGDNALVAAGSVVVKGTRILANEIWGGLPAKKIGNLNK